jgi:hypothetical protein
MSIKIRFIWYDLWVGIFIDKPRGIVYICPLPTLVIIISKKLPIRDSEGQQGAGC